MDRSIVAFAACSFFAVLVMSSSAAAEIYRWDDEDGNRHLTNDLNEVPAQYRDQALADDAGRKATNSRINIIDAEPAAGNSGGAEGIAPRGAPAPAAAAVQQQNANPMPGGQSEMWWRQTALQLQRNVAAAQNALDNAQDRRGDDDSVSINRRRGSGRGRGPGRRGRVGGGGSDSSDYTEYSYERDLDELEVAVADAERAYQDFHDQARRAEVPKGWLRR